MVQHILIKILLFPFSLLYGFFSFLFNALYELKFLDSTSFSIPVINVGNLTVGGSGKTPHTEYLIRLLSPFLEVAVLSRGYRRKSKGFREVLARDTVHLVGDEPLLYKRKYKDIGVYVDVSRSEGIPAILMRTPGTQVILLDDAFQHRAVKPGLNILLTPFDNPFSGDFFLPTGSLREWRSAYKRADVIIVSKCPADLTQDQRESLLKKIRPQAHQTVFFSGYSYRDPYYMYDPSKTVRLDPDVHVLLVSAIASSDYLIQHLSDQVDELESIEFNDHHVFTLRELEQIRLQFERIPGPKKILLTTEKDAMRLDLHRQFLLENKLPVFVLPVHVFFHFGEGEQFDEHIRQFLLNFKI